VPQFWLEVQLSFARKLVKLLTWLLRRQKAHWRLKVPALLSCSGGELRACEWSLQISRSGCLS